MDWSNDCNHANGLCEWEHYPTSGLPPTCGVWCIVVFELEYHLDVGVASACPWIGAMTVTMPMDCANGSIIRHQVCLLPVVFGVLLSLKILEYHLDVGVASECLQMKQWV